MTHQQRLNELLNEFRGYCNQKNYEWHFVHDGGQIDHCFQINAIIHGNEVGSLPAVVSIVREIVSGTRTYPGRLSILLGNPEAAGEDVRFLESDLNRMFLHNVLSTHEACRARTLMPILDDCDLLLDLHQTILHSEHPFYIFPFREESLQWARAIGATGAYVDATPTNPQQATTRCADEYVWLRNVPAVTLELGEKGFSQLSEITAYRAIVKALAAIEKIHYGHRLVDIANEEPPLQRYVTVHREVYPSLHHQLRPGLINFLPVVKGEALHRSGTPPLIAPHSGMLLFPKYIDSTVTSSALPKNIYRIIQPT